MKNISVYVLNADKLQEDLESSKENIIKFGKKYSLEEFEMCFNVPSEFGDVCSDYGIDEDDLFNRLI